MIVLPVLMQALALYALHHMLLMFPINVQHAYLLIIMQIIFAIFVVLRLLIAIPAQMLIPVHYVTLAFLVTYVLLVIPLQDIMQ